VIREDVLSKLYGAAGRLVTFARTRRGSRAGVVTG
jgi:hypothetical protein